MQPFQRLFVIAGSLAVSATLVSAGLAADLGVKTAAAPVYMPPAWTWTGFYVGPNLGYAWGNTSAGGISSNLTGVIGGGQLGYNWQTGPLVLGVEGDFQGSSQSRDDTGVIGGTTFSVEQRMPWFATLRGRIGYAQDAWMIYFTGGAAWLDYHISASALGTSVSSDTTKTAWTVGAGVEWMFIPRWSAKLEYLYMDGGDTSVTLLGTTFSGRARDNIIRAGVNYHF